MKHLIKHSKASPAATAKQIKGFRQQMDLTQDQLAEKFDIPLGTLRDWEQGRCQSLACHIFVRLLTKEVGTVCKPSRPGSQSGGDEVNEIHPPAVG